MPIVAVEVGPESPHEVVACDPDLTFEDLEAELEDWAEGDPPLQVGAREPLADRPLLAAAAALHRGPVPVVLRVRAEAVRRRVEQALPDGWIPRARVASTRANATSESPPRVSVRARERVTIEPFARRCVRWPPRASRGSLRQEIPPPTFGRGEARHSGAKLWCGRTSGGPRACICINRMGDQSLKITRGGFLRSICTPANFICRGKWRTVGCVLARTPGRDARRRKDRGTRPSARHHADPSHQLAGQV